MKFKSPHLLTIFSTVLFLGTSYSSHVEAFTFAELIATAAEINVTAEKIKTHKNFINFHFNSTFPKTPTPTLVAPVPYPFASSIDRFSNDFGSRRLYNVLDTLAKKPAMLSAKGNGLLGTLYLQLATTEIVATLNYSIWNKTHYLDLARIHIAAAIRAGHNISYCDEGFAFFHEKQIGEALTSFTKAHDRSQRCGTAGLTKIHSSKNPIVKKFFGDPIDPSELPATPAGETTLLDQNGFGPVDLGEKLLDQDDDFLTLAFRNLEALSNYDRIPPAPSNSTRRKLVFIPE